MEVAMWLCAPLLVGLWSSLGLVSNYDVWVVGNESGGPHHRQMPMDWFKEASSFYFEYLSNIQLRFKIFFLSLYLCLAQRLV